VKPNRPPRILADPGRARSEGAASLPAAYAGSGPPASGERTVRRGETKGQNPPDRKCDVPTIRDVKRAFDNILGECTMHSHDRLRLRIVIFEICDYWSQERAEVAELRQRVERLEAEVRRLKEGRGV
jgi:hypothetical protein